MSVYFAEAGGYVKIGYSADPIQRATTITRNGLRPADLPFDCDVDLIGWVPGDEWRERAIHIGHLASRVAGEWFELDRELVRDLIWRDPSGVDLHRMTAAAVFACIRNPGISRAEVASAGIQVVAPSDAQIAAAIDALLTPPARAAA